MKVRNHQEGPEGSPEAKMAKTVVRYALLKGSRDGPGKEKSRIALTLQRFERYGAKMLKRRPQGGGPNVSGSDLAPKV